jgi:hypothetical protein
VVIVGERNDGSSSSFELLQRPIDPALKCIEPLLLFAVNPSIITEEFSPFLRELLLQLTQSSH